MNTVKTTSTFITIVIENVDMILKIKSKTKRDLYIIFLIIRWDSYCSSLFNYQAKSKSETRID